MVLRERLRMSRRRWGMLLAFIAAVAGVRWWLQPAFDPRLVGHWEHTDDGPPLNQPRAEGSSDPGFSEILTLRFAVDPRERSFFSKGTTIAVRKRFIVGMRPVPDTWQVAGDRLTVSNHGRSYDSVMDRLKQEAELFWEGVTGTSDPAVVYRILEVTDRQLVIQQIDAATGRPTQPVEFYHRISEEQARRFWKAFEADASEDEK